MRNAFNLAVLSCAIALPLVACTQPMNEKSSPEYRRNPNPVQAYRITIQIDHAPGPFAEMTALAQYDVVNKECLRPPKDNPGGHTSPVPTEDVEIPLAQLSDVEYVGTVYADWMLDEDYSGRGVCHWELIQFRVRMKATGAERETRFVPGIMSEKLLTSDPETVYFNKASYPRLESSSLDEPISFGQTDRSRFGPSIQDDDLFTVTFKLSKDEVVP